MIDFDNKDSSFFNAHIAGIRQWANQRGCDFWWDGFVPSIKCGGRIEQLDMHRLTRLAKDDKYKKFTIQINNAIERAISG